MSSTFLKQAVILPPPVQTHLVILAMPQPPAIRDAAIWITSRERKQIKMHDKPQLQGHYN